MATGTAGSTALFNHTQQVSFLRKGISHGGVSAQTVTIGTIPAGSLILLPLSGVLVTTIFDGTTPVLDIGITGTLEKYGSDLALTAKAFVPIDVPTADMYVTADKTLIGTFAVTGTPTAGAAIVIIAFVPNVDD